MLIYQEAKSQTESQFKTGEKLPLEFNFIQTHNQQSVE